MRGRHGMQGLGHVRGGQGWSTQSSPTSLTALLPAASVLAEVGEVVLRLALLRVDAAVRRGGGGGCGGARGRGVLSKAVRL